MALYPLAFSSPARRVPAARPAHSDPLRRLFGLRLLGEPLPPAARTVLLRAWMQPRRFDGNQAIQSLHRQRPAEASLPLMPRGQLRILLYMELEASRRIVETPRTEIKRDLRNDLLRSQATYLSSLYAALALHLGEPAALAEFERLLRQVS